MNQVEKQKELEIQEIVRKGREDIGDDKKRKGYVSVMHAGLLYCSEGVGGKFLKSIVL